MLRMMAETSPSKLVGALLKPWTLGLALSSPPVSEVEAVLALFPDISRDRVESLRLDLLRNERLYAEVNRKLVEVRGRRTHLDGWREFLYLVVRVRRPGLMVETGVFDGESSAVILQAMADEGQGQLVSIDLPAVETIAFSTHKMKETRLPLGSSPGWLIPDRLRDRHRLLLGDSRDLLPAILRQNPTIDIFFHDSLHTLEHQLFEYSTAWPHLAPAGVLLSDDILWNAAFHRFCRRVRRACVRTAGGIFGAVKK